ncbi:MAG TPA: hypothetical protein VEU98_09710 [Candidatus Eremiobacteraceae bacterium]|nr:hypothetical protein [Candidatus Eremiobacteraceae bacterium]
MPYSSTILVHNDARPTAKKIVRQSVSLPAGVAAKVRSLAKTRKLSSNRVMVELIENGLEAEKRKEQECFELAEQFRSASDPQEAKRLGDELGRMVFGGYCPKIVTWAERPPALAGAALRRFKEILDPPDNSFLRVCKLVRVCKPCVSAQRAQTMFFLLVPIA